MNPVVCGACCNSGIVATTDTDQDGDYIEGECPECGPIRKWWDRISAVPARLSGTAMPGDRMGLTAAHHAGPPPLELPREARNRMMDAFEKRHSMQDAYDALASWWATERDACRIENPAIECRCGLGQCRKGLVL